MTKKTHIFVAAACVMPFTGPGTLMYIPTAVLGGIFPDFDFWLGLEHRTVTHSTIAMAFLSMFMYFTASNKMWALCFAIGYLSHLLLDSLTVMGVPWLYPNPKRYSAGVCKTRDSIDLYIRLLAIAFIVAFLKKYIGIEL